MDFVKGLIFGPPPPEVPLPLDSPVKPLPDADALRVTLKDPKSLVTGADNPEEYVKLRWERTWNIDAIGIPLAIVVPECEEDVQAVVRFAAKRVATLRLGVCCGRHSHLCMVDDTLVCDLHRLNQIHIDDTNKDAPIVHVGGGCLLGQVDAACKEHGVGVPFGHDPTTGVGGLTLNGGHGFLERHYGLSIDHLVSARIVLASGDLVECNEQQYSDLFWAIRGGGGNFGVVTQFTFRTNKLQSGGMFLGGPRVHMPFWPMEGRAELLDKFVKLIDEGPNELTGVLVLASVPVINLWLWTGERQEGVEYFKKHIWSYGWPVDDWTKKHQETGINYWDTVQKLIQGPDGKNTARRHYYLSSLVCSDVTPALRDEVVACHATMPNSLCIIGFIPISGKVAEYKNGCVASREGKFWILIQASWGQDERDPLKLAHERVRIVEWVQSTVKRLEPLARVGTYGTLPTPDELDSNGMYRHDKGVHADNNGKVSMYGEHLPKLQQIKKKYDPLNVFNVNSNILPAK